MKSSDRVLAGRYASALFLAASAKNEEQKVQTELGGAQKLLLDSMNALRHPRVSTADKKRLLEAQLSGKVSATTLKFLDLLVEKKRFELLPMVGANFARMAAEKRGAVKAVVRTARPLSAEAQKQLAAKLKTFAGKDVEIDIKEDPELIGGVSVKIGDWVLDSSLRGQLRRMKESIYQHGH